MRDFNGDGIPDGAEVEMKAKWVKGPVRGEAGTAYAGESRGGFTDVGRTAIENTMRGGGDDVDAAFAGMRTEREFQPTQVMDQGRRLSGSASDVMGMMDRGRAGAAVDAVPLARTGSGGATDADMPSKVPYNEFQDRTNTAVRMMTGGVAGGQSPNRDERLENARRVMSDPSQSLARRQVAGDSARTIMADERQERQLVSDQRIQEIMSGGRVDEAKATAEGNARATEAMAGATRFKAEQERMGQEATAGADRYRADKTLQGQLEAAKATLEGLKYGADQETLRAREAAKARIDSIRAQMASGVYQGEIVRHDSGMIGVWDDERMDYKWQTPPSVTTFTELPKAGGGTVAVPTGSSSPMKIDALPVWKQQTPVGEPPVAGALWSPKKGGWVVLRPGGERKNENDWLPVGDQAGSGSTNTVPRIGRAAGI